MRSENLRRKLENREKEHEMKMCGKMEDMERKEREQTYKR